LLVKLPILNNKILHPLNVVLNPGDATTKIVIKREGTKIFDQNVSSLLLDESIINQSGEYEFEAYFNKPSAKNVTTKKFYVSSLGIQTNKDDVETGEEVKVTLNINAYGKNISFWCMGFGDGNTNCSDYYTPLVSPINKEIDYNYNESGNKILKLDVGFLGESNFTSITKNGINVSTPVQTNKKPTIKMIYPEDGGITENKTVYFQYIAKDDTGLKNCTFKLYNRSGSISDKEFKNVRQTDVNKNGTKIKIPVVFSDGDEGEYLWEVECYDASGNYEWNTSYFDLNFNYSNSSNLKNYDQKDIVEKLISESNSFMERDNWSSDEKEALESLGILTEVKSNKQKLININNYFQTGEKAVASQDVKSKLKQDYLNQIESLKGKIPLDFKVVDSSEYVKNSINADFEKIVSDYFSSTNTKIRKNSIKKIAKFNKGLQQEISVSTQVKKIEIKYSNRTESIMLVNKKIELSGDGYDKILEIIPKNIAEKTDKINFISKNKVINEDPVFEVMYDNLDNGKLSYYIKKSLDVQDFEDTQTILFEESPITNQKGITGFFSLDFSGGANPIYFGIFFLLALVFIALVIFVGKKFRMYLWKKDPNVTRATEYISEIKGALRKGEIENSREMYYKLKQTYIVLPEKTKEYFYREIKKVFIEIDKKDIFGMVREYEDAKREFRKDDSIRLYKDIKKVYERLPKKYKEKVYERITR
jgi:hypothetical protein